MKDKTKLSLAGDCYLSRPQILALVRFADRHNIDLKFENEKSGRRMIMTTRENLERVVVILESVIKDRDKRAKFCHHTLLSAIRDIKRYLDGFYDKIRQ